MARANLDQYETPTPTSGYRVGTADVSNPQLSRPFGLQHVAVTVLYWFDALRILQVLRVPET